MATREEVVNAILKGIGFRPTFYLLRWAPSWRKPWNFDLVEVSRCGVDGGIVTPNMPQRLRPAHAGHRIYSPQYFSLWELIQVQLRLIR